MPSKTPQCVYEVNVGLFRVLQNKGKSFSSGGYGVMYNSNKLGSRTDCGRMESKQSLLEQQQDDTLFLFVEETLFLKERSLLHVLKKDEVTPYTTSELYHLLLQEHQIPLQVYLTYAHLRSQTFIVIRHTSDRIHYIHKLCHIHHHKSKNHTTTHCPKKNGERTSNVGGNATNPSPQLQQNQGGESNVITTHNHHLHIPNDDDDDGEKGMDPRMVETTKNNNSTLDWKEKRKQKKEMEQTVKKEFRKNSIEAPVPTVYNHKEDHTINIAFDIYKPNASFSKMNPGIPDFYIAIFNFADPSPTFTTMMNTVKDCNDITLRLATVTDTGTVMVFGVTDFGVPSIK